MTEPRRKIAIGSGPVEVELGDTILKFRPPAEVDAGAFLDASQDVAVIEERARGDRSVETAHEMVAQLRSYVAGFLLPESAETFAGMSVPMGALRELTTVVAEVYGGGRPTGSSNGSAPPPSPPGTGSTGSSPSKAPTRKRGR